ncbi:uncharacterized protein LOC106159550 [Lingula anatina]|uniref:Uncharacterized protein LOC106159550 n=1 Tax=Lingula anatina TaxID=7574 RepID=A0A1S3I0G3_LINAN|nr:uncharacterized protein LOC106159550 [Lingula anatina]|eukprot:XP_013391311.1 uncharacterized protein LOC106159550 [Lingula anatina]
MYMYNMFSRLHSSRFCLLICVVAFKLHLCLWVSVSIYLALLILDPTDLDPDLEYDPDLDLENDTVESEPIVEQTRGPSCPDLHHLDDEHVNQVVRRASLPAHLSELNHDWSTEVAHDWSIVDSEETEELDTNKEMDSSRHYDFPPDENVGESNTKCYYDFPPDEGGEEEEEVSMV